MPVDRCICKNVSFSSLISMHRESGRTVDDLCKQTGCGDACGMCTPYVHAAIATGKKSLPVCSPAQLTMMVRRHQNATDGRRAGEPVPPRS